MLTQMLKRNLCRISSGGMILVIAAALLVGMTGSAAATKLPIVGPPFGACNSSGSGCLNGGNVTVQVLANSCINFFNGSSPDACGSPDTFGVSNFSDPNFTPGASNGSTQDLMFGVPPPDISFLTAPGFGGTVIFDLEGVIASALSACPALPSITFATTCSAGIFSITQQSTSSSTCPTGITSCGQVSVAFAFSAIAYLGNSVSGFTPYVINYTSQFNNETVGDLINKAASTNGISNSVSFTANPVAIPEPAGFVLIGAGLIGISLLVRRRASRM